MYLCRFYFDKTNSKTSHLHLDLLFILVSGLLYFIVHFLFFPVTWLRFFVAQYSLAAVVVLWTSLSIMAERNYSGRTNVDLLNH